MGDGQKFARVAAVMSRAGWSRHSDHVATVGNVTGRGSSMANALADVGEALTAMAARVHDAPMFGWDADNRSLWVAVPSPLDGGSTHYVVHFDKNGSPSVSAGTTSDSAPAREAWQHASAPAPLPSPFYRD